MRLNLNTVRYLIGCGLLFLASCMTQSPSDRAEEIKSEILSLAEQARATCDSDDDEAPESAQISTLLDELVALVPEQTENEKLPRVTGGWKQVWGNGPTSDDLCVLTEDVYQVVDESGFYWNISKSRTDEGEVSGLLRGVYIVSPEELGIEFTTNKISPMWVGEGANLLEVAAQAEGGAFQTLPEGPSVGQQGFLVNSYVDDDLRIIRGGGEAFGDDLLYVLTRTSTVQ